MGSTRENALVAKDAAPMDNKRLTGSPAAPGTEGCLLDYQAAARYLSTTPRHVRKLWETRRLAAIKVGCCVRFAIADLDAFIVASRVPAVRQPRRNAHVTNFDLSVVAHPVAIGAPGPRLVRPRWSLPCCQS